MSDQNTIKLLALGFGLTDIDPCGSTAMSNMALNSLGIPKGDHNKIIAALGKVNDNWVKKYKSVYMKEK